MSERWGRSPSEYLGVKNRWVAYCFDLAVFRFTVLVEAEIASGKKLEVILGEKQTDPIVEKPLMFAAMSVLGPISKYKESKTEAGSSSDGQ